MATTNDLLWERWDEVDQLLDRVLDQPADQRRGFLANVAGDDRPLHDLVLRLLDQMDSNPGRLDGPSDSLVLSAFSDRRAARDEPELAPGTEVGHYVIVGYRGRGGMATVYEAERADGSFDQRVAIKVLRRGLDTDDLIARFRDERQILSSLAHASVARLLDGGALADGRPYLVMELVDGAPITKYADSQRLTLRERLALFIDVANAVHAAHRQLVVHRDIKPSNILVSTSGEVKLLDFGIAKLLTQEHERTSTGVRLLTPDYASPEQLRGERITTSSDIYQLGLLLRELLTGAAPLAFDAKPGELPAHLSRIATLPLASTPSPQDRAQARRTSPAALATALRGDLDILVGQALRADPQQRYASAEAFAEDVRRYLEGRPILAHPESAWYLLGKFLARNRWVAPAAAAALVSVLVFIAILTVQNRQLAHERDAAQLASERASATEAFLVDMLRSPDPTGGTDGAALTVVDALARGRERLATELVDQPLVRASLLAAIGRTLTGLGRLATADSVLRQALVVFDAQLGPSDPRSLAVRIDIGANYRDARDLTRADSVLQEALRIGTTAQPLADSTNAVILSLISGARLPLGEADSALAYAARAVTLLQRTGDTMGVRYTNVLGHLAPALRGTAQFDSAATVYDALLERQLAASPPNPSSIAATYNNIGFLQKARGDRPAAERSYRAAQRLANSAFDEGHPESVLVSNNLAALLEDMQRFAEVEALLKATSTATAAYWPTGDWRVGAAQLALGRFYLRRSRPADAVAPLRAGWEAYARSLGESHAWTIVADAQVGVALSLSGRPADGARHLGRLEAWVRELPDAPNTELRGILQQLATALDAGGVPQQSARIAALIPPR